MAESLVVYGSRAGTTHAAMNRLHRRLFGYRDSSNHGRYSYSRPGLLTGHAVRRVRRGVVVVPRALEDQVRSVVAEHGAWCHVERIVA